jgi:hypothetical protein
MRRILITLAVVIVLVGVGVTAYFYFAGRTATVIIGQPNTTNTLPTSGDTTQTTQTPSVATGTPVAVSARLVQITTGPVVPGEVVVDNPAPNASSSADETVSYIERESGNVYSYSQHTGTLTRTSNRTVPGIQEASWLPDASLAFVRYLSGSDFSTINTYALPASGSDDSGFFLPQDIADIAVSSTSILTLASGVNGSVASVSHTDGTHSSEVFATPLSTLNVSFAGKNEYLAYTKPSATLPGAAFLVDSKGNFSRVAGPLNGLVAKASPSGKWVLVSYTSGGTLEMNLVDVATGEVLTLPVATIADKCVWTADESAIYCGVPQNPPTNANYPDDWYQGAVSFSDQIWKIQVAGRYAQLVLDFSKTNNVSVDVEAPAIDPLQTTLVFVNKDDGSLWSYSL